MEIARRNVASRVCASLFSSVVIPPRDKIPAWARPESTFSISSKTCHRAPWKWTPPLGLTTARGTAVRLTLTNHLSPLVDAGYLRETIRRHFEPLLDSAFADVVRRHYPRGVAFEVDGRELTHRR
jgi:hypothetical protein